MEYFYDDLTRDEVCKSYADYQGSKYGFTNKDFAWADEYDYAKQMNDTELYDWCVLYFG